jgi:uncharacterized protein HemX
MYSLDITAICLSVIGMASGWVGWFLDRRKHHQEVKNLEAQAKATEAETERRYMELAKMYVDEYTKNIVRPLELRVNELTQEVKELKDELETVKKTACYRTDCPDRICVFD